MFTLIVIHEIDRLALQRAGLPTRIRAVGGHVTGSTVSLPCDAAMTTASASTAEEVFEEIIDTLGASSVIASTPTVPESELALTSERSLSPYGDLIVQYAEFLYALVESGLIAPVDRG